MARKLGLTWSAACCACALLAGCQTGGGSRFANHSQGQNGGAFVKQSTPQQPSAVTGGAFGGQRNPNQGAFSTSTNGGYPAPQNAQVVGASNAGGMQPMPHMPPMNMTANFGQPAPGPGISPIGTNPPNHVQITQPYAPSVPMVPGVPPPGAVGQAPPSMPPSFPPTSGVPQPSLAQPGIAPIQQLP